MKQKVYFQNLDAIRFIAFFLVYIYHGFGEAFNVFKIHINTLGAFGVSIFFVLSGFLITYLILKEIELNGKLDIKSFYIRRGLRIWPLYYVIVFLVFFIYPFFKTFFHDPSTTSSNPFYFLSFLGNFDVLATQKYFNGNDYLISNNLWTVAVEEQFYLVWPLLFLIVNKRFLPTILYTVIIACFLFRGLNRNDPFTLYFHTLSVCGDLALGGLTAYYSFTSEKFRLFFINMSKISQFLIYFFLGCLLASSYFFSFLKFHNAFGRLFYIISFAFLILNQSFANKPIIRLSKYKLIDKWGKYTYGLYLLHAIALLIVHYIFSLFISDKPNLTVLILEGLIAFPLSFLLSYISYHYFESYFLKWKKKFTVVETI